MTKFIATVSFTILLLCIPACNHNRTAGPIDYGPPAIETVGELPDYDELVARYNTNLQGIDRLWARADVRVDYKDEKGKRRSDRGDQSVLMIKLADEVAPGDADNALARQPTYGQPSSVALALGGLGKTVLWIGCNEQRYWVFNLQDEKSLHYGLRANIGALTTRRLPAPIYPNDMHLMLGLEPLVPSTEEPAASYGTPIVEWSKGYWLVETPWNHTRTLIDPATALPVRIDRFNEAGLSDLIVRLSEHEPVEFVGIPAEISPRKVATNIEAWVLRDGPHVRMKLRDVSDGRGDRKKDAAFRAAFNLEQLLKAHNPKIVVDLDQP